MGLTGKGKVFCGSQYSRNMSIIFIIAARVYGIGTLFEEGLMELICGRFVESAGFLCFLSEMGNSTNICKIG